MDLLKALKAINFNNHNSNGVLCNGLWTLEYRYKINSSSNDMLESVQLLVTIKYDGGEALHWGCTKEDQLDVVNYILKAESLADDATWQDKRNKNVLAIAMLKEICE